MILATEFRIQCDRGRKCLSKQRVFRDGAFEVIGIWTVVPAHTRADAHRKALAEGWVRREIGTCGPTVDLCPECAAS